MSFARRRRIPSPWSQRLQGAACVLVVLFSATSADAVAKRIYTTERVTTPPRLDGKLDDAVWNTVEWGGDFLQRDPAEGEPPTGQTRFKIIYDDVNLYVAVQAFDPEPEKIASLLGRRDNFPGDWVEINIDSFHDHRTAFSFTASVSGTRGDEFISNDGNNWDGNWDPVWEHATRLTEDGYIAEMRIPFSQLRYGQQDEQVWGLQVQRRIFRGEERSFWQEMPKNETGWVSQFGELHGIRGLRPTRRVELLPYTVAQAESFKEVPGDPFADGSGSKFSGGLDGKLGVTSDLTLDFTVNPDFGQVEADPSEVNLTAFETFFPEKRPFFIEGANIFEFRIAPSVAFGTHTRDRLLYSRRIGRSPQYRADFFEDGYVDQPTNTSILGAAKLTGKTQNGLSIGFMESVTAEELAEVELNGQRRDVTVEPLSNHFVGRLQKDFRQGDTRLGVMTTAVNRKIDDDQVSFLHESAYAGGLDFFHYLDERDHYVAVNLLASRVAGSQRAMLRTQQASARYYQRPDNDGDSVDSTRTSLSGQAGSVRVGSSSGNLNFDVGAAWRSSGFELNDLGFLRTADEINQFAWVGYRFRNPFSIFREMGLNLNQWLDFEYGGENTYRAINFNTDAEFSNNWRYNGSVTREAERISMTELRGGPSIKIPGNVSANLELGTDWRQPVSGGLGGSFTIHDDDAGRSNSVWTWLDWRPTDATQVSVSPSFTRNRPDFQFVESVDRGGSTSYVYGALDQKTFNLSLRVDFAVTADLTIQYYGSPFVSAGRYSEFKRITAPRADGYEDRFISLDGAASYDAANDEYVVDEDDDGLADYRFPDPDFNVRDFNSNLVLRWEYSPGSSFYAVWSQARFGYSPDGHFDLGSDVDALFDEYPHDVFLIKFNRWFTL